MSHVSDGPSVRRAVLPMVRRSHREHTRPGREEGGDETMIAALERGEPAAEDELASSAEASVCLLVGYGRMAGSLAGALQESGRRCFSIDDYESALRDIERWPPDLVLVGRDGARGTVLDFLARVRSTVRPDLTILYLAECQDVEHVTAAIRAGADDVVCPPHSTSAILMREHVLRRFGPRRHGAAPVASRRVTVGGITADLPTRQVRDGEKSFSLSGREFELLVKLMEAGGDVVAREELYEDIWGTARGSEAALDATVHRLRRRLGDECRTPELVVTVRGVGYRLDVDALDAIESSNGRKENGSKGS